MSSVMYSYVSKKRFNKTQRIFSDWYLFNTLTYSILRKNLFIYLFIYLFMYTYIKEKVAINAITNIKLNFSKKKISLFIWFLFKIEI